MHAKAMTVVRLTLLAMYEIACTTMVTKRQSRPADDCTLRSCVFFTSCRARVCCRLSSVCSRLGIETRFNAWGVCFLPVMLCACLLKATTQ